MTGGGANLDACSRLKAFSVAVILAESQDLSARDWERWPRRDKIVAQLQQ